MPRVQDEDLEAQRRGANGEVGEREATCDHHLCGGSSKHGIGVHAAALEGGWSGAGSLLRGGEQRVKSLLHRRLNGMGAC